MTDRFRIALAQLNPVMGDIAGNLARARAARAPRRGRRCHPVFRTLHRRLSARRSGAEAGAAGRRPRRGGRAGARHRGRRPGHPDRRALGGRRQALQRRAAAGRRQDRGHDLQDTICPITACSTRSASSPPGPLPRAVRPCAACELGVPICEDIWTAGCRAAALAEAGARNSAACPMARPSRPARKMCG